MRAIYFLFAMWTGIQTVPTDAAVEFLTGVDRDTITIGDPFVLRLRVHRGVDDKAEIAYGKNFPQPFEIRHTGGVETEQLKNGRVRETQDLVLAIYQVGAFRVPPVSVHFVNAEGDSGKITSQPIDVLVQSVRPEGTTDIRDVKPPWVIVAQIPAWFWLAVGGLILLLAGLVWYIYRRRHRPEVELPPPPINWLEELDRVGQLGLIERENYRQYYSLLSAVLRRCLEAKTPVHAVERTTFEIGRDLRAQAFDDQLVMAIEDFLNEADRVKFAKFAPRDYMAHEAMDGVRDIVSILITPSVTQEVAE
ncbi:MAG: protein BatD [Gemmatimonadetes bacterium]|nr:protein BatD [Gemmatimonadota bacterium]MYB58953.1 protein BatD [Gemmatimonadota bacterium]MYD59624.1 protein BatD [Gemmatimonadota bacterium]